MESGVSIAALADPTRRRIFEILAKGPAAVGQLASELPVSRPAVSQHLKILSNAGLVTVHQDGTRRIYSSNPDGLDELRQWLDQLWDDALDRFAAAAEKESTQ